MSGRLYLDTSAVLRAVLETGTTPDLEERIRGAELLITSRLSQVEAARAILRLRLTGVATEAQMMDAERQVAAVGSVRAVGIDPVGLRAGLPGRAGRRDRTRIARLAVEERRERPLARAAAFWA